tara:strand:- start:35 stop:532 length:498 start_codon:yes stop_codon:yes gene_type:complete
MNNKIAVFPGSFDPLTLGHIDIIEGGLKIFENIIIAIGVNEKKEYLFKLEQRQKMIELVFANNDRIMVKNYHGLTTSFCQKEGAQHIIRGIRDQDDFEQEKAIALANYELDQSISTSFLLTKKEHAFISSTITREIILNKQHQSDDFMKEQLKKFIPEQILNQII